MNPCCERASGTAGEGCKDLGGYGARPDANLSVAGWGRAPTVGWEAARGLVCRPGGPGSLAVLNSFARRRDRTCAIAPGRGGREEAMSVDRFLSAAA